MSRRPSGFTLIEMLIVIAIIGLLSAITVPLLLSARMAGQRTVCISNLRQLHGAFMLYCDDHDGQFPATDDHFLWMGRNWRPLLEPYVNNRKLYWCPVDATARYTYDSTSYAYMQAFYHKSKEMISANKGGYHTCNTPSEAQPIASVTFPVQKILIYEWYTNHQKPLRTIWDDQGAHMAAFVDGHVQLVQQERLNLSALGDHDPNWTVGGIGGKDTP